MELLLVSLIAAALKGKGRRIGGPGRAGRPRWCRRGSAAATPGRFRGPTWPCPTSVGSAIPADVVQSFDDKVHLTVRFTRYRADGSTIGEYHALYVVTNQDGQMLY